MAEPTERIIDDELLKVDRWAQPMYPQWLEELLLRLGLKYQVQRHPDSLPKTLSGLKRQLESEIRGEPNEESVIGYLKRINLMLIEEIELLKEEIEQLKGV